MGRLIKIMTLRLWMTGLDPSKASEYDALANSRSLAMFRALEGCMGVIFVRSDERGYVLSSWRDTASIEALEDFECVHNSCPPIFAALDFHLLTLTDNDRVEWDAILQARVLLSTSEGVSVPLLPPLLLAMPLRSRSSNLSLRPIPQR